jgi:hypothetical protein
LCGGRSVVSCRQYLQGALSMLMGSQVAGALAMQVQKARRGKRIDRYFTATLAGRYAEIDHGPQPLITRARNPFGSQPLSSLLIEIK